MKEYKPNLLSELTPSDLNCIPSRSGISLFLRNNFPLIKRKRRRLVGKIIEGINWQQSNKILEALLELLQDEKS